MKLIAAMMQHETNTFSPLATPLSAFGAGVGRDEPPVGADAAGFYRGTGTPLGAFIDLAERAGAELEIAIAANAEPSGPVSQEAFETIAERICRSVAKGCDGILLDLHGAMVTETHDDGEGELLHRIRRVAPDLPIAVALDFHSHITQQMVDNASVITGYRTYPHIDMYETGARCGEILLAALHGRVRPRILWGALPLITHLLRQDPSTAPMKAVMAQAIAAEASGRVLAASVFGGFPYADIPHVSLSAVVVADQAGQMEAAEGLRDQLLATAWQRRADFVFEPEPLAQSIAHAKQLDGGPIVIADHGDNAGAGGPADDMTVIAEMLRQGLSDIAAGPIWDPEAVAALHEAGQGADVTLSIGGKTATPALAESGRPLTLSGRVAALSDGRFTITGPMMTGFTVNLGRTALLETGALSLVVSEQRGEPFDLGYLSHIGIEPRQKRYLVLKSRQHFRAGFEPIARHIVLAAGPGVCGSDYDRFEFRRLARPIYPLDPEARWQPDATLCTPGV